MRNDWQFSEEDWKRHQADHAEMNIKLDRLLERNETVAEIVSSWNNARGFVNVVRFLASMVKWLAATGAAIGSIWYGLHWLTAHLHIDGVAAIPAVPGVVKRRYEEMINAERN